MYIVVFIILICIQYPLTRLEPHPDELMSVVLIAQNNPYYFLAEIGKDFSPPLFHIFMKIFSVFTRIDVTLIRYVNIVLYVFSSLVVIKSVNYISIKKPFLAKLMIGLLFFFSLGALNLVGQARNHSLAIFFSSISIGLPHEMWTLS